MITRNNKKGISIIICCYNSATRIRPTLEHIMKQQAPGELSWEVLLINNNSSDDTVKIAEEVWREGNCKVTFRIIDEPRPGLSHARKKGVMNAQYEYLLFCDDDNWLKEDYLSIVWEIMESDLEIGVLGGRSEAVFEVSPPKWFKKYSLSYAVGDQYESSGYVTYKHRKLWGAGSVYRKKHYEYIFSNGFRHLLSDRIGNSLVSGGDHELCMALRLAGFELYYDNRLCFKHFITKGRFNWNWFLNFFKNAALMSIWFDPYEKALNPPLNGIKGKLKETVWYEVYLSIRKLIKIINAIQFIWNVPNPNSPSEHLQVFHEINRIKGLIKYRKGYRKRLYTIRNASWCKLCSKTE
jgi:glycosyltransferase involved in cell wall biosynthesis